MVAGRGNPYTMGENLSTDYADDADFKFKKSAKICGICG
jgi:hypothetical protein